jgi:hypothetical protein
MIRRVISQPTERQHIGNQIDAAMILAQTDFVNMRAKPCARRGDWSVRQSAGTVETNRKEKARQPKIKRNCHMTNAIGSSIVLFLRDLDGRQGRESSLEDEEFPLGYERAGLL